MTAATETRTTKGTRTRSWGPRRSRGEIMWRGGRRAVGSTYSRIVLGTTPGQSYARVTDWITLHLVNSHFGRVTMDELDESATLSRRNLDVGYLPKPLEEGSQFVFGYITRKTAHENSGVVWIGELVHRERVERRSTLSLLLRVAVTRLLLNPRVRHAAVKLLGRLRGHLMSAELLELTTSTTLLVTTKCSVRL